MDIFKTETHSLSSYLETGDESFIMAFVQANQAWLIRYFELEANARRLDPACAKDVFQTAAQRFTLRLRELHATPPEQRTAIEHPHGYFVKIMFNLLAGELDHAEREQAWSLREPAPSRTGAQTDGAMPTIEDSIVDDDRLRPDSTLERNDYRQYVQLAVRRSLEKLTPKQREVIFLVYALNETASSRPSQPRPHAAVATVLGIAEDSVRDRLDNAYRALRTIIEAEYAELVEERGKKRRQGVLLFAAEGGRRTNDPKAPGRPGDGSGSENDDIGRIVRGHLDGVPRSVPRHLLADAFRKALSEPGSSPEGPPRRSNRSKRAPGIAAVAGAVIVALLLVVVIPRFFNDETDTPNDTTATVGASDTARTSATSSEDSLRRAAGESASASDTVAVDEASQSTDSMTANAHARSNGGTMSSEATISQTASALDSYAPHEFVAVALLLRGHQHRTERQEPATRQLESWLDREYQRMKGAEGQMVGMQTSSSSDPAIAPMFTSAMIDSISFALLGTGPLYHSSSPQARFISADWSLYTATSYSTRTAIVRRLMSQGDLMAVEITALEDNRYQLSRLPSSSTAAITAESLPGWEQNGFIVTKKSPEDQQRSGARARKQPLPTTAGTKFIMLIPTRQGLELIRRSVRFYGSP